MSNPNFSNLPCPALPRLGPRQPDAHKGDFGNALLIGGSRGMSGSIAMSGMAAVRGGAGLVRVAVPDCCLETVASFSPCLMTIALAQDGRGQVALAAWAELQQRSQSATCVAVGPGIGKSSELQQLMLHLLRDSNRPLVVDADGLNNLAEISNWAEQVSGPLVLTPHPGEWSRLSGVSAKERMAQSQAAVDFARRSGAVIVLKGHQTLVTDGQTAVLNQTGTPAMATGGSGDVLTGLIAALICQGLPPRDAAHLGVHLHGMAAEMAQRRSGAHVVLPTELIDALPAAIAGQG